MSGTATHVNSWLKNKLDQLGSDWLKKNEEKLARSKERHHTEDDHFALWMSLFNQHVAKRTGLSYDDFEDWDFRAAYESDMSPAEAAQDFMVDNGLEGGGEW